MSRKYQEMEQLHESYDTIIDHKKVKEITYRHRKRQETRLSNNKNKIILAIQDKFARWKENKWKSAKIGTAWGIYAIKTQKNGKTHVEIFKLTDNVTIQ